MKPAAATHAYIGVRPSDGSVRAICCDDPGFEKQTAKIVSDWIVEGRTVERLLIEDAKARMRADVLERRTTIAA